MATEIKEVSSKRDLKSFIYFPFWLYNGNNYWVPPLIKDEKAAFDKNKNPFYNNGDTRLYLVYKDRRIAGRVAVLAKHDELASEQKMRFGWLDFEDDREVSSLLFEAIEESARELKATKIEGPVSFSDDEFGGILIKGFQEKPTLGSAYNSSFYQRHIEACGFEKKHDAIVYNLSLNVVDSRKTTTQIDLSNLSVAEETSNKKALAEYFAQTGSTFKSLQPFILKENILVLKNLSSEKAALSVVVPSFVKTIQRTKGRLSLLAFLFQDKKKIEDAEFLIHIKTEESQAEIAQFLIHKALLLCKGNNIKTLSSYPLVESSEMAPIWENLGATQSKRRRVFEKIMA